MITRIVSFPVVAILFVAATPAGAYDPSDPTAPPPDDPAAYMTLPASPRASRSYARIEAAALPADDAAAFSSLPRPSHLAQDLKPCTMMFAYDASGVGADDPGAYAAARDRECSCKMKEACAHSKQPHTAERAG